VRYTTQAAFVCDCYADVCSQCDELSQQLTEALTSLEPARQVCTLTTTTYIARLGLIGDPALCKYP